jgi:glycosyltransferase involved in cell wall biosynthesis
VSAGIVHLASGREWRGGQRQTWLLARELDRLGVRDQVVVTGAGSELARRLAADGVRVRGVRWRRGLDPRALLAARDEARAHPALLHAHDAHALTLAGLARIGLPSPLVVTRRVTFPLRRRGFWTRADRVIAISAAVRSALTDSGVSAERIDVIPSGVDLAALGASDAVDLRAELGLAPGTPLALNIAALTPEKDHGTLLDAAARVYRALPALHWAIAGDGPLRDAIGRRVRDLGLEHRVSLLGFVPEPERLLAAASVFVLSSTAEGLGTSVLAAWARGVPVVATRAGGLAELLASGAGLLAPPGDPAGLAEAVLRVVTEPELHDTLSRRGRAEAERYDVRGMAERVLAVYRSCGYRSGRYGVDR